MLHKLNYFYAYNLCENVGNQPSMVADYNVSMQECFTFSMTT